MDEILWDRDYEDEADFMDLPPERAAFNYRFMRVDPEYFQHIVSEPTKAELTRLAEKLSALADRFRGGSAP